MKKETKTCVQCHKEFSWGVKQGYRFVGICTNPACPNYALLATAQEDMPEEKK